MPRPASKDPRIATAKRIHYRKYSDGDLSFEDFYRLSQQPCHYCGVTSSNVWNKYLTEGKKNATSSIQNGYFGYNGLDRTNNSLKHDLDNVVPCCKMCNLAKRNVSYDDFIAWIDRAYHHLHQNKGNQ